MNELTREEYAHKTQWQSFRGNMYTLAKHCLLAIIAYRIMLLIAWGLEYSFLYRALDEFKGEDVPGEGEHGLEVILLACSGVMMLVYYHLRGPAGPLKIISKAARILLILYFLGVMGLFGYTMSDDIAIWLDNKAALDEDFYANDALFSEGANDSVEAENSVAPTSTLGEFTTVVSEISEQLPFLFALGFSALAIITLDMAHLILVKTGELSAKRRELLKLAKPVGDIIDKIEATLEVHKQAKAALVPFDRPEEERVRESAAVISATIQQALRPVKNIYMNMVGGDVDYPVEDMPEHLPDIEVLEAFIASVEALDMQTIQTILMEGKSNDNS